MKAEARARHLRFRTVRLHEHTGPAASVSHERPRHSRGESNALVQKQRGGLHKRGGMVPMRTGLHCGWMDLRLQVSSHRFCAKFGSLYASAYSRSNTPAHTAAFSAPTVSARRAKKSFGVNTLLKTFF